MFLGACLVNRKNISFEYFLILQGTGANGKSVIYRVLKDMFGDDEILNIKMSQFARSGDEQLRAAYSMTGKRLMYCSESNRGDFKDMSIIKAISSGEPVACRGIGGNITMMQRPPVMICNSQYFARLIHQFQAIPGSLPIPGEQVYALIKIFIFKSVLILTHKADSADDISNSLC